MQKNWTEWVGAIAILALLYYLSGRLGLLLAIPPGYATAVWPPSGIALAGLLILGEGAWLGVLLGSFALNLGVASQSGFLPLGIALGATVQTFISVRLVKRILGSQFRLEDQEDTFKFLLLAGPLGCLTNATASTLLLQWPLLFTEQFATTWFTWWVGDTMGVFVFTPLILFLHQAYQAKALGRRHLMVTVPLIVSFSLVIIVFLVTNRWERESLRREFDRKANSMANDIRTNINNYLEVVRAVGAYTQETNPLKHQGFSRFAEQVGRYPGLHALAWSERVLGVERKAWENRVRREIPKFTIRDFGDRVLASSSKRDVYYPITDIYPWVPNEIALGVDITTESIRREFVDRAFTTKQIQLTPAITLIQNIPERRGVLIYVPVFFENGEPRGIVSGALRLRDVVAAVTTRGDLSDMALEVWDETATDEGRVLYSSTGSDNRRHLADWQLRVPAAFGGRKWSFIFSPIGPDYVHRSWQSWSVLVAGMIFCGLLGAFLLTLEGQTRKVERLVQEKTRELSISQSQLVHAARMLAVGQMSAGIAHEINNPLAIIQGYADELSHIVGKQSSARAKEICAKVMETTTRISTIVKGLRMFARESEGEPFKEKALAEVVSDTLGLCGQRLKSHGVKFELKPIPKSLKLRCRPVQLSQVLLNLINNAFDATEGQKDRWVNVAVTETKNHVEIAVSDSGPGVSPLLKEKIFEPFFTTKEIGKGTGLGLSISRGIIEAHGGTLTVDLNAGHSRFLISLPRKF